MAFETTIPANLAPTAAEKAFASAAASPAGCELAYLGTPVVADPNRIVDVLDPIADGDLTVIAQPDVPRNITVTVTDANDSVSAVVTVTGKDMLGKPVSEVATIAAGVGKSFVGTKMFAQVDSAVVSGTDGAAAGDTVQVGVGNVIALPKPISNEEAVRTSWLDDVPVTPDAIATGDQTSGVDLSGETYDGTKPMRVAYRPGE